MEGLWITIFIMLGTVVAVFLNICIDRLPGNASIFSPRLLCASCNHRLTIKDIIPIFSYIWLRGNCRYCQATIPRRIIWVEAGTGALFGYIYWHYGLSVELAINSFYCCLFIILMVIDLEHKLILNKVTYPAIGIALIINVFSFEPGIVHAAIGGGIGLGLFLLIALISRGGMGWGDVKMAALIGLITGYPLVFVAIVLAIIFGGLVAIAMLLFKKKGRKEGMPFGPFLSLGVMTTLLFGAEILDWFLNVFQL
jgi:prepilin signal peptidase PulO-like enzyme (type II secretory pathway)